MRYVIAYDIANDRQRTKLSELLLDYGERVQKSVFEADLKREEVQEIIAKAANLIEKGDSVRAYPVCENCCQGIEIRGRTVPELHVSFKIV